MRRSVLAAALWATTALAPGAAHAGPAVAAFISGFSAFVTGATGMTVAMGTFGSVAFGYGYAAAQFLTGTVAGRLLVNVGLSYAINRLTRTQTPPQQLWANFAQPISYATTVYGQMRVGGPLGFTGYKSGADVAMGRGGAKRHYVPVLGMHDSAEIVEHYLADKLVELDGNGVVTTEPEYATYYRIRPFVGAAVADPELMARFPEITSAHNFKGLTGAYIWCARPSEDDLSTALENGRQATYTAVIKGRKVYDPRTETTIWSRNAALVIADVIVNIWGQSVDWDEVADEADVCDQDITIKGGATRKRWTIDITLTDDQDYEDQRSALAAACDAWFYERSDGKVGFKVGAYEAPDITLTDRDFFAVQMTRGQSGSSAVNRMAVKYTEPNNAWKETATADLIYDEDANELSREDPAVYGITEHNQAFRIARRMLAVRRPGSTWTGTVGLIGYWLTQRRFWQIEHSLGTATVEVQSMERSEDGLSFTFEAVEVQEADFDPDVADIEPDRVAYETVENEDAVPNLEGVTATVLDNGTIRVTWTMPDDDSYRRRVRIRPDGETDWQFIDVAASQTYVDIAQQPGTYEIQAINRTNGGKPSPSWMPLTAIVVEVAAIIDGGVVT